MLNGAGIAGNAEKSQIPDVYAFTCKNTPRELVIMTFLFIGNLCQSLDRTLLKGRLHQETWSVPSYKLYKPCNIAGTMLLTLRLPERQKAPTPLRSQSAKKRQLYHSMIEEVLSCMPVFEFLKSDHY